MGEIIQDRLEYDKQPAIRALRYIAEEMELPEHLPPVEFRGFLKDAGVTEVLAWATITHGEKAGDWTIVADDRSSTVLKPVNEIARGFKSDWPPHMLMLHYDGQEGDNHYGLTFHLQPDFSLDTRVTIRGAYSTPDVVWMLRAGASNFADALEGKYPADPYADAMFEELPAAA